MAVVGLVVAAGSGERLGAGRPKAFVECAGRPLLEWSVDALRAVCDRVVVAVPPELAGEHPDRVAGAAVRSGSVRAALAAAPEAEIVVVHDAARPLVTAELVERCAAALAGGWDGAVAAVPATDTLKQVRADDGRVTATLARAGVWAAQTPQVFRADVLRAALDVDAVALAAASDDASLVEAAGGSVCVVEAPAENIKVTNAFDLAVAEWLLRERGAAAGDGAAAPAAPAARPSGAAARTLHGVPRSTA